MFLRIKAVGVNWFSFYFFSPFSFFFIVLREGDDISRSHCPDFPTPRSRLFREKEREREFQGDSMEIVVFKLQREIDRFSRNDRVVTSLSIGTRVSNKLSIRDCCALRAAFYTPREFAASFQSV